MNEEGENVLQISGRLTIDTAASIFENGLQFTQSSDRLTIDMSKVEVVDSTAVSLMLFWLRTAQANKVQLMFANVPVNLLSLANLYGLAETFSLTPPAN